MKNKIGGLTDWVTICDGIEVCEFVHQFQKKGSRARRHFVVRKQTERRPEAGGKQLFEELPVKEIWNVYNGRADCENRIKELKQDFGLESFCLKDFWACEASFRWTLVAYNLVMIFQHSAVNSGQKREMKTLRSQCFAIGAWTANHTRKKVLKLSLTRSKRPWMDEIRARIYEFKAPFLISTA